MSEPVEVLPAPLGEALLDEGGLAIRVTPPSGGAARASSVPDLSRLPGARVVAQIAHDGPGWSFGAGCARAPSDRFVSGVEGVIFEKATWFTLRAAALVPDELSVVREADVGGLREQTSTGRLGADAVALRHVLTFSGPSSDVVVCSAVCRGPEALCARAVEFAVSGTPAPPPAPGLLATSLAWGVANPLAAAGVLAVVAIALVTAALRTRPADP